ncbi:hypothetical protein OG749_14940 [Streptomyces nojiriensis]|uniref:hypothetical protein n=1 Tax=Streptomyces nojiriensis TaxID=66374 RepID=UPI002E180CB9
MSRPSAPWPKRARARRGHDREESLRGICCAAAPLRGAGRDGPSGRRPRGPRELRPAISEQEMDNMMGWLRFSEWM